MFKVEYGNQFDFNKMKLSLKYPEGVNFVSRTGKNLGVIARVEKINQIKPYPRGLITVALGGSILSSFLQKDDFYTAQNISVLTPKKIMTDTEKIYYCICISKNKFRYSTFGREANKTLKNIELPNLVPNWTKKIKLDKLINLYEPEKNMSILLNKEHWKPFRYKDIFIIKKGKRIVNKDTKMGKTPCIRPINENNGVYEFIGHDPNHVGNSITVNYNGSVGEAFYQPKNYFALDDINVLYPKFKLNEYIGLFLVTLIRKEKYRFNYGRKWHKDRMEESVIKLPVDNSGNPNWKFMEDYMKSLPYSKAVKDEHIIFPILS